MTIQNYLNPKMILRLQAQRTTMRSGILIPPVGFLSSTCSSMGVTI